MNKISHKLQAAMMSVVVGLSAMATSAEAQIDSMQPPIVTAHEGFGMGDHREGDLVTFQVVRSQHRIDAPLDVQVSVSQRGNVLKPADVGNKTLHFDAWADLAYIDLDTIDDQIDEADGSLTFSIRSGSGYRLGSPTRLSTNVRDDDVPSVSIQASTTSVQAGRPAVFRLSRNGITRTASTISLDVSQEGAVLTDAARAISTVQFRSGQSSATLSLATKSTAGAGKVFVAVLPGEDYASDIGNGYATVNVTASSAQLPVVSFMDADETIIEGQPASFEVRRNAAVSTPLTVSMQLRASRSGVIGAGTFTAMNVTIPAWSTQGTASVDTQDNTTPGEDATVRATIVGSSGYRTGTPATKTVTVEDDEDTIVRLTKTSPSAAQVVEGTTLNFRVTRTGRTSQALVVPIEINETQDMVTAEAPPLTSVTIAARSTYASFRVRTENDTVNELPSVVTVAMGTIGGRTVGSTGSEREIQVRVTDNDLPTVTISSSDVVERGILEGQTHHFFLTRVGVDGALLATAVRVRIDYEGDMFPSSGETRSITIPLNARSTQFSVTVPQNAIDQANGRMRATVLSGTGYVVGATTTNEGGSVVEPAGRTNYVNVWDDDVAVVGMYGPTGPVREGQTVTITLRRDSAAPIELPVRVGYAVYTGWPGGAHQERTITFPRNAISTSFTIRIGDDPYDLDDATLEVDLVYNQGNYSTIAGAERIELVVEDNDTVSGTPPTLSLSALSQQAIEGGDALFRINRTGSTAYELDVNFLVSETGDMTRNTRYGSATIPTGARYVTARVRTYSDVLKEDASTVTVELNDGLIVNDWYTINHSRDTVDIVVADNHDEQKPELSIYRVGADSIREGTDARFRIVRVGRFRDALLVSLNVSETGDMLEPASKAITEITIEPNESEVILTLETVDDHQAEDESTISVGIKWDANYDRNDETNPATVEVTNDNDAYIDFSPYQNIEVVEGSAVEIVLEMNRRLSGVRIIEWGTEPITGGATPGTDYTAVAFQRLRFGSGDNTKTVTVQTTSDTINDSNEKFKLVFRNIAGNPIASHTEFSTGTPDFFTSEQVFEVTITNDGVLPKAYISGMGREVSRHVVESLTERLRSVERGDASQMSPRGDDDLPTFNMTKDGIGLWSSASSRGFEVAEAEGNVDSYTVAADVKRGDWLFGLGVTHSEGDGKYEATTVESDLTTAHPYAAWMHREWLAWATLGKGTGTLKMHDTESDAHYAGIDINHTMLAAGVDREHRVAQYLQVNAGVKGFWSVTKSGYAKAQYGHVLGAKVPNLSLSGYSDWTFNPEGPVQPTLGLALAHERDDYETQTELRPSVGLRVQHGAFKGHVNLTLIEGEWDAAGDLMFDPRRGFYAGLTRAAPESNLLGTESSESQLQLESGWKRSGMSPYIALGADTWRVGQKTAGASHEIDMSVRNTGDSAEVRVELKMRW